MIPQIPTLLPLKCRQYRAIPRHRRFNRKSLRNFFLILLFIPLLSACGVTPIALSVSEKEPTPVEADELSVRVLDIERTEHELKFYTNDFLEMPSDVTFPPFPTLIAEYITENTVATETGESLEIRVMSANVLIEKNVTDDIVFVGLLTAFRDRAHRCEVVVEFKSPSEEDRHRFSYTDDLSMHWIDTTESERQGFIDTCVADIHRQLVSAIGDL
jgi:hypothetical protein